MIYPVFSKNDPRLLEKMEGAGFLNGAGLGVPFTALIVYGGTPGRVLAGIVGVTGMLLSSRPFQKRLQEMLKDIYPTPKREEGKDMLVNADALLKAAGVATLLTAANLVLGVGPAWLPLAFSTIAGIAFYRGHKKTEKGLVLIGQRPGDINPRYRSGPPGDGPRPA